MTTIGVQYYRPPFPLSKAWEEDFSRIADSGLNAVQLWVVWAWVEPAPGEFHFEDYDRLIEMAAKKNLTVVLSTIAAVQPYWIHREVPGSEMVDNTGNTVVSSNRTECHFGLTPGGCIDHPGVWARMKLFLRETVSRYRKAANLAGWDAWNELRWKEQADGLVCYCDSTVAGYRVWLEEKYGDLAGLNRAWLRRYGSWEDVLPGKMPNRPYTEMMAFQHYLSDRAVEHALARSAVMRDIDAEHPITVHGCMPSVMHGLDRYPGETALHRGNDWFFADHLDGIGSSVFPVGDTVLVDDAEFACRLDMLVSAARGKKVWLSELQGGRAAGGFSVPLHIDAAAQQRWVWMAVSRKVDTLLFWCWRDEVFGCESAGFGLSGNDGHAEERLAALRRTRALLDRYNELLSDFEPDDPEVGIFFSPQTYYLHWAETGSAATPLDAIRGYARALTSRSIPYKLIEQSHLDELSGLKVLFMPRTIVTDRKTEDALREFVESGGYLVVESEFGAFSHEGIYREPQDRFLASLAGVAEKGRRKLTGDSITVGIDGEEFRLPASQWTTPIGGDGFAFSDEGELVMEVSVGSGRILYCGTYLGDEYYRKATVPDNHEEPLLSGFEAFLQLLTARAGVVARFRVTGVERRDRSDTHSISDISGNRRMVFAFAPPDTNRVELVFRTDFISGSLRDLHSGSAVEVVESDGEARCLLPSSTWGISVLVEE